MKKFKLIITVAVLAVISYSCNNSAVQRMVDKMQPESVVLEPEGSGFFTAQPEEKFIVNRGYDIVIHGATYDAAPEFSDKNPNLVLEKNLRMFFNIARCSDHFGKMIYFGSGAEFNRENWTSKMKESYYNENVPIDQ